MDGAGGGLLGSMDGAGSGLLGSVDGAGGGLLGSVDGAGGGLLGSGDGTGGALLGSGDDGGLLRVLLFPDLPGFLWPFPTLGGVTAESTLPLGPLGAAWVAGVFPLSRRALANFWCFTGGTGCAVAP
ncbi:hypothetical protein NDU88_000650 [Pleurodeles waltl]|uniref:Uncharacterized protein n=1 Tax=Pleurodeles waltl TaxID=8319 RepID=A0AAV7UTP5_PLEWA|nr:hypothetical protein NDU88_000650 [Pleurodeles waltl]